MDLINPYAVMRNTATYEAFKAYNRKAAGAGAPFLVFGFVLTVLAPQLLLFASPWLHQSPTNLKWAVLVMALSVLVGAAFIGVAVMSMIRFRKDNPIPDEWRQVPRSNPLVAARKARLYSRG